MKRKKLEDLLQKMASHSLFEKEENVGIVSLNDELSQRVVGGRPTVNDSCANSNNATCANEHCAGSTNGTCGNTACIE